jgi:RNA polymerase sigma factor (sigma-70 family)
MDQLTHHQEDQWIAKACNGDRQACKVLYDNYKRSMMLICMRYNKTKEDAEDCLQEGFANIFNELHRYDRQKGAFYTWISRLMININLQKLRKNSLELSDIDTMQIADNLQTNQDVLENLTLQQLVNQLQAMPTGYRTVFNMYYIDGYNHREIGEILGISENTSKTQLMKSKAAAREILIHEFNFIRS